MTLIIISGGIDLSVGSMAAFTGGISMLFLNLFPPTSPLAVLATNVFALIFGGLCGA